MVARQPPSLFFRPAAIPLRTVSHNHTLFIMLYGPKAGNAYDDLNWYKLSWHCSLPRTIALISGHHPVSLISVTYIRQMTVTYRFS